MTVPQIGNTTGGCEPFLVFLLKPALLSQRGKLLHVDIIGFHFAQQRRDADLK